MHDVREALMQGRNSTGGTVRRPLSPHLQIYRPQITSALSIMHRISGVMLGLGAVILSIWLAAAASSPAAFSLVQALIGSILGQLVLFGFTLTLFFHFFNGIRHLLWDAGFGFELPTVHMSGKACLVAAAGMTVLVWIVGLVFA